MYYMFCNAVTWETKWDAGMYKKFWDFGMWDLLKCKRCVGMLASRRPILMRECMRLAGILKCENYRRDVEPFLLPTDAHNVKKRRVIKTF